jgi:hypothetical protein
MKGHPMNGLEQVQDKFQCCQVIEFAGACTKHHFVGIGIKNHAKPILNIGLGFF